MVKNGNTLEATLSKIKDRLPTSKDVDSEGLDLQRKRYENQRYRDDTQNRKKLTIWAATVVSMYLVVVFAMLMLNHNYFHLSETVLSVLLGTTTLNVLGLMYIVLKGYFNAHNRDM